MAAAIDVLMRLLIVNPNTSETTNQRLRHAAVSLLDQNDDLEVISAPSGVSLIETPKQSAETVPYVVSLIETMSDKFDAVIIAAFSDPGLHEARKIAACPYWVYRKQQCRKPQYTVFFCDRNSGRGA